MHSGILSVIARRVDMPYKKMLFQRSLDVIIDGISMSEARADRAKGGGILAK